MVGRLRFSVKRLNSQSISPFNISLPATGIPNISGELGKDLFWEEKTGEKRGLIFKNEEIKKMNIQGYRCILCNYIEIFAKD